MSLSHIITILAGVVLLVFGVFLFINTPFGSFDQSFVLHLVGAIVAIILGVVLVKGGNISL